MSTTRATSGCARLEGEAGRGCNVGAACGWAAEQEGSHRHEGREAACGPGAGARAGCNASQAAVRPLPAMGCLVGYRPLLPTLGELRAGWSPADCFSLSSRRMVMRCFTGHACMAAAGYGGVLAKREIYACRAGRAAEGGSLRRRQRRSRGGRRWHPQGNPRVAAVPRHRWQRRPPGSGVPRGCRGCACAPSRGAQSGELGRGIWVRWRLHDT